MAPSIPSMKVGHEPSLWPIRVLTTLMCLEKLCRKNSRKKIASAFWQRSRWTGNDPILTQKRRSPWFRSGVQIKLNRRNAATDDDHCHLPQSKQIMHGLLHIHHTHIYISIYSCKLANPIDLLSDQTEWKLEKSCMFGDGGGAAADIPPQDFSLKEATKFTEWYLGSKHLILSTYIHIYIYTYIPFLLRVLEVLVFLKRMWSA